MSKNKFTSGPWWSPDGKTIKQDYRPLTEAGGCIIAGVMGGSTSGPYFIEIDEEVSANTRLIAAAPDLLQALENLVSAYSEPDDRVCCNGVDCGCFGATKHQEAEHYARAAIAKARGE